MTAPRILIAGDSYSDVTYAGDGGHYSWVQELQDEYTVECVAHIGASNVDIWNQIKDQHWDFLIVNLSSPTRLPYTPQPKPHRRLLPSHTLARRVNYKICKRICELPRSCVWTPWYGYEQFQVEFKPFTLHNELYTASVANQVTGNHLTPHAHRELIQWAKQKITQAGF